METKKVVVQNGEYFCDIGISVDEWKAILQDKSLMTDNYKDVLLKFYSEPEHKSTCEAYGRKHNVNPQSPNSTITNFAKAVQKKLNRFEIIGSDGNPTYWIIPMLGKNVGKHFEWTIRPELVQALKTLKTGETHPLQTFYNEAIKHKHWVFFDWFSKYKERVNLFKQQAIDNNWTDEIFQSLVKDVDNGISSLQQGNFTWNEFEKIKINWPDIQPIIKNIAEKNEINQAEYKTIFDFIAKQTDVNRPSGTNRIIAALLPNYVTSVVNYKYLKNVIHNLKNEFPDYPEIHNDWLFDNVNFIKYCNSYIDFVDPWHSSVFAWYLKDTFEKRKSVLKQNEFIMKEFFDLLVSNKNLILTGAPGTGKTYLAKKIAEVMNAETEFVQFHPSYDYTDFVEGLRPIKKENSELGFELKDGIFKAFCKKALQNLIDSAKSEAELKQQQSIKESLSSFIEKINDEIADNGKFELTGIGGKPCAPIIEIDSTNFITKSKNENTITTPLISILTKYEKFRKHEKLKWTFREVGEKLGVTYHHTYFFAFLKAFDDFLKNNAAKIEKVEKVYKKDFVFIIDEINRAEVSKVFGELFFSIDPGYRGEIGKVKTQYTNLLENDDVFADGFYVPENVYIIGTMNDIDRSVESMDFAMRRRFAWIEIKAPSTLNGDNIPMWNEEIEGWTMDDEIKNKATKRIISLNNKIEITEGLNSAYHIGPSYFLKLKEYSGDFEKLWNNHLEGVLFEYLRGLPNSVEKLKELKEKYDLIDESENN